MDEGEKVGLTEKAARGRRREAVFTPSLIKNKKKKKKRKGGRREGESPAIRRRKGGKN